jgi:hypothetical protein
VRRLRLHQTARCDLCSVVGLSADALVKHLLHIERGGLPLFSIVFALQQGLWAAMWAHAAASRVLPNLQIA